MSAAPAALPDPAFCGCDPSPDAGMAGGLLPVDEAIRRGLSLVRAMPGTERLPLAEAHGRVLASALRAPCALPPFDQSAMDGYALRLADLDGAGPWRLGVAGHIAAGDSGLVPWPAGSALRILTGAPVPGDCDAVVMQEAVQRSDDAILVGTAPRRGANIRRAGEDVTDGAPLLAAGRVIDPRAAAVLAASGVATVEVRRRLRVAILSTGSELRQPGEGLGPGQIWNANRYHLAGALALPWVEPDDHGTVPDRPADLAIAVARAAAGADLLVTTGGISAGDADHLPAVLGGLGAEVQELRLAMKPGRPLALGRLGDALWLGLPGNPVSAFVAWHVIGARLAEALAGIAGGGLRKMIVRASFDRRRVPGRCEFLPARLTGYGASGAEEVAVLASSASHRVALLAEAEGLLLIPAEVDRVTRGDLLEFMPF